MGIFSAAIKHMFAAGMKPEAITAAIEDMEAAATPKRSKAAERQARYRERIENERNETSHVAECDDKKEKSPTPPKEKTLNNISPIARVREAEEIRAIFETVLPKPLADALLQHRRKKKTAQTPHAARLLVDRLLRCRDGPEAAANLMIVRDWKSYEPEWDPANARDTTDETLQSITAGILAARQ